MKQLYSMINDLIFAINYLVTDATSTDDLAVLQFNVAQLHKAVSVLLDKAFLDKYPPERSDPE